MIDAHVHLWQKQQGRVNGLPVYSLGNGRSQFGAEVRQMLPPDMTDGVNSAERLLSNMDFAQVAGQEIIDQNLADQALSRLEVDRYGLDQNDRRILNTIVKTFGGGPVGVDTIAAAVSEESGTIEDVVEPYLMQLGLLQRTPRGRVATRETYRYLGIPYPEEDGGKRKVEQPSLL